MQSTSGCEGTKDRSDTGPQVPPWLSWASRVGGAPFSDARTGRPSGSVDLQMPAVFLKDDHTTDATKARVKAALRRCEALICEATLRSVDGDIAVTDRYLTEIYQMIGQPEFPTDLSEAIAGLCRTIRRETREAHISNKIKQSTASLAKFISDSM